jgi:methylmalonic aciduria homocystinuria type C protein
MTSERTDDIAAGDGPAVKAAGSAAGDGLDVTAAALVAAIAARCVAGGLDLCATCAAEDYDREVPPAYRLPSVGRPRALVIVVGNTRALWPVVRAARATSLAGVRDPIDRHAEATVRAAVAGALAAHAPGTRVELRFAPEPPPRRVALQRLASVAGLAWLSPSHLCVHRVYGRWIGVRAAIVVDVDGPPPRAPLSPPCVCAHACLPRLDEAMAGGVPGSAAELRPRWHAWLAVRDACPVGRAHRYDDDQLRYHYAGERDALDHEP